MRTVAVLNEKGGSGKTTIATNLAAAWHRAGRDVLLLDADPQLTALDWSDTGESGVTVAHLGNASLEDDLPRLGSSFEIVVIDGAPRMGSLTASAVSVADLVLIPVQPSAADIWSAETVVDVCEARDTAAAFVVSRAIVGTRESDVASEALDSFDLPVLEARTNQRVAYVRAMRRGVSVLDVGDDKAAAEVESLADEVLTYLNQSNE